MRLKLLAAAACASATLASAPKADAYAIDCAILLCLAGGFPASSECAAAKIELIRRITPWPIEPPLQLWNCPMGMSGSRLGEINALLAATGQPLMSMPQVGADGLAPEVRQYRDAIEVWELHKRSENSSGGREVSVSAVRNFYDSDGEFVRQTQTLVPAWVRAAVEEHTNRSYTSEYSSFRAILLRLQDYSGAYTTEWITY